MKLDQKNAQIVRSIVQNRNSGGNIVGQFNDIDGYNFPLSATAYFLKDEDFCVLNIIAPAVTTPLQFEAWMLRQVTRTVYNTYKVEDLRYKFDFSQIGPRTAQYFFDKILSSNGTKSWLKPLQDIILDKKWTLRRRGLKSWMDEPDPGEDLQMEKPIKKKAWIANPFAEPPAYGAHVDPYVGQVVPEEVVPIKPMAIPADIQAAIHEKIMKEFAGF